MNRLKPLFFIFIISFLSVFSLEITAQNNAAFDKLYNQAKSFYEAKNFKQAIITGKKAVALDDKNLNIHLILGYSYEEIDSLTSEIYHLKKALELAEVPDANYWLGEAYLKLEEYSEALYYYNQYKDYEYITGKRKLILACKIASSTFEIQSLKNIGLNRSGEEIATKQYWPASALNGKLVFKPEEAETDETLRGDLLLLESDTINANVSKSLTSKEDENVLSNNSVSDEPQLVFFTACNREDGLGDCDIYFSRLANGIWSEASNAGNAVNTQFLEAQPSFSAETGILYFSSNRPGGKGEKDIWQIQLKEFTAEGLPVWGKVENVSIINSKGNEISPFVDAREQNLYFASDSQIGMGGFDLFQSSVTKSGTVQNLKNMGYPINTNADELGLLVTYMYDTAFLSSARAGDKGLEIFAFNLTNGLHTSPSGYFRIKLINRKTKKPIEADFDVVDVNATSEKHNIQTTDSNGEKIICLQTRKNYDLNIAANGYMFYSLPVRIENTNTIENPKVLNIELDPIEIGAEIDLYNIYYETNSFAILPTSEPELLRLATFLAKNEALKVEIQGHTDSTGDPASNLKLSEQRAKSVFDYLVRNRISASRLKYSGYGDKVSIATNDTEEGRKLNRRTTIKITAL